MIVLWYHLCGLKCSKEVFVKKFVKKCLFSSQAALQPGSPVSGSGFLKLQAFGSHSV